MFPLQIKMKNLFTVLLYFICCTSFAQTGAHTHGRSIEFPDVPGFKTLICDFHQHTVFSDGSVWPDIRIQEALRDSIDAVSMTEHIEYQPYGADIPHPDRNRSYEIAEQRARPYDLMVVHGAEITRRMPPGHNNAIFIEDANKLMGLDSVEVFREANRQGGFVFWNHANWTGQNDDGIARMTATHEYLINEGLLHGIEVINDRTYSDEALQIALDYNLTIMATSDIHGLVDWQYNVPEGGHRPVTLVFAEERSPEATKEALLERRTVGWFNDMLVGRPEHLQPLMTACLEVVKAEYQGIKSVLEVVIKNHSDAPFLLMNQSEYTFHDYGDVLTIQPNVETTFLVKTLEQKENVELIFTVLNALTAPGEHPDLKLNISTVE